MNTYNNIVRTFTEEGKVIYETKFKTAEEAYEEYVGIIDNWKNYGVPGRTLRAGRFVDNDMMTFEKVVCDK